MQTPRQPKILITTAGFGDGHNSAAYNLAAAFAGSAEAKVIDPCALAAPYLNQKLRDFYRFVTTHTPKLWYGIYKSVEKHDFEKESLPLMRKPELALRECLDQFQPDAFVSTYPLYPYYVKRAIARGAKKIPTFTLITDSININTAWLNAPTDYFLVTDDTTKGYLISHGITADRIIVTGFSVHPHFTELPKLPATATCDPFRILYFPTSKKPTIRRVMRAVLDTHPSTTITIVLGRNVRKLYGRAKEIKDLYPNRVTIKGWTKKVPELLTSHHIAIGKAGGATVHEALAASCPMLIHHLVPGQEEGNLELLKQIGAGQYVDTPSEIKAALQHLMADSGKEWRTLKARLEHVSKPAGAIDAAQFILDHLSL